MKTKGEVRRMERDTLTGEAWKSLLDSETKESQFLR